MWVTAENRSQAPVPGSFFFHIRLSPCQSRTSTISYQLVPRGDLESLLLSVHAGQTEQRRCLRGCGAVVEPPFWLLTIFSKGSISVLCPPEQNSELQIAVRGRLQVRARALGLESENFQSARAQNLKLVPVVVLVLQSEDRYYLERDCQQSIKNTLFAIVQDN